MRKVDFRLYRVKNVLFGEIYGVDESVLGKGTLVSVGDFKIVSEGNKPSLDWCILDVGGEGYDIRQGHVFSYEYDTEEMAKEFAYTFKGMINLLNLGAGASLFTEESLREKIYEEVPSKKEINLKRVGRVKKANSTNNLDYNFFQYKNVVIAVCKHRSKKLPKELKMTWNENKIKVSEYPRIEDGTLYIGSNEDGGNTDVCLSYSFKSEEEATKNVNIWEGMIWRLNKMRFNGNLGSACNVHIQELVKSF